MTLTWADYDPRSDVPPEVMAVGNGWLQVTVLANARTGLTRPDVFYFGNAIGETFNSATQFKVDSQDVTRTRNAQSRPTTIASLYDHNLDNRVNTQDQVIARNHQGFTLARVAAPPGPAPSVAPATSRSPADRDSGPGSKAAGRLVPPRRPAADLETPTPGPRG